MQCFEATKPRDIWYLRAYPIRREEETIFTRRQGYDFVISHGGNHDIVKHPDFPELRATLPRHRILAKGYVEFAVKLVDRLLELQKESKG